MWLVMVMMMHRDGEDLHGKLSIAKSEDGPAIAFVRTQEVYQGMALAVPQIVE